MKRLVVAGGSGFLGRSVARALADTGWEVVILSRSPSSIAEGIRHVVWDGASVGSWVAQLDGAAALLNLCGRSVDCRYTEANRREIVESRVHSVEALGRGLARCSQPPPVWIQAASLAIYGDAGSRVCDEDAAEGEGFSVEVCRAWEDAFWSLPVEPTRRVLLRIGLVLGRDGGALERLATLTRHFLGGRVGDGRQYLSWLHEDDFVGIVRWCIETDSAHGTYNATGNDPRTNAEFMAALRRVLHRPWTPPTPAWAVRLAAPLLLRTEAELALSGRRCVPARLLAEGWTPRHTDLEPALAELFAP